MNYNYLQQGGLTSIPARPVFRGQQHQLGYLTPNQSELLRKQGGGVTPFGGQYKGPGGLNTFFSPLAPTPEDGQPPGPVNGLGGTTHRRWWSCFVAGAEILLDNHMVKKVEEVEKGDRVHGIDEQINTVKSLISTITGGRRLISINNGNYFTTEDHPFMVANGSWKSCNGKMSQEKYPELNVDQLQIGDKIKGHLNKKTEVESINFKEVSSDTPLYNFELDNDHTYIVNNYVMHNKMVAAEDWERSEEERRVRRDPFYTESSSTSLPSTPSVGRDPFSTEPSPTSLPSTPSVERDPFSKEPSTIPEESFFNTILNNFLTGEKNRWILQYPNYPTTPISTGFSPDVLPSLPPAPTESHPTKNGDLSYFPTTPVFPSLPSGYGYPSTTPTPATTPIPPTSTPTVATNPLFPITPPATPAAETVTPEAPLTLGSGTVLGSPESAGQFNFQGKSFHIHPAQHGGGIQSLPIRPVLSGQQHELSYITPGEAQLLRQYGGGVTPDGGQYRGPGGIPSFIVGGETSTFGGVTGEGVQGVSAGTGSTSGGVSPGAIGVPPGQTPAEVDVSDRLSKQLNQMDMLSKHYNLLARNTFKRTGGLYGGADTDGDGVADVPTTFSPSQFANQPYHSLPEALGMFGKAALGFMAPPALGLAISLGDAVMGNKGSIMGAALSGDFGNAQVGAQAQATGQFGPGGGTGGGQPHQPPLIPPVKQTPPVSPIVEQALSPSTPVYTQPPNLTGDITIEDIRKKIISAQTGGGIQSLVNRNRQDYSVRNQNNMFGSDNASERKPFSTNPEHDLLSGEGYISNIMGGHTVPMGLTNTQQMEKPFEAFPTGGQMNNDNTQYADYSRPQSFYSMPNMNRVT